MHLKFQTLSTKVLNRFQDVFQIKQLIQGEILETCIKPEVPERGADGDLRRIFSAEHLQAQPGLCFHGNDHVSVREYEINLARSPFRPVIDAARNFLCGKLLKDELLR